MQNESETEFHRVYKVSPTQQLTKLTHLLRESGAVVVTSGLLGSLMICMGGGSGVELSSSGSSSPPLCPASSFLAFCRNKQNLTKSLCCVCVCVCVFVYVPPVHCQ